MACRTADTHCSINTVSRRMNCQPGRLAVPYSSLPTLNDPQALTLDPLVSLLVIVCCSVLLCCCIGWMVLNSVCCVAGTACSCCVALCFSCTPCVDGVDASILILHSATAGWSLSFSLVNMLYLLLLSVRLCRRDCLAFTDCRAAADGAGLRSVSLTERANMLKSSADLACSVRCCCCRVCVDVQQLTVHHVQ